MEQSNVDERYLQIKQDAKDITNKFMYYIFVALVIVVMVFIQLSVLEFNKDINWLDIVVSAAPMLVCTLMLDRIMYCNGSARGKSTTKYASVIAEYSDVLNGIDGDKLCKLPEFCKEYTEQALIDLQKTLLKPACVTYEQFSSGDRPLRVMNKKELVKLYGIERARHICKAKRARVKGLYDYELTTENNLRDRTDVGHGERYNESKQSIKKTLYYIVSTICFSLIGVKDISLWGWAGVGVLLLKIAFTLGTTLMSRNQGYSDIVISLVNHYTRKIDILKQFLSWYTSRPIVNTEEIIQNAVQFSDKSTDKYVDNSNAESIDLIYLATHSSNKVIKN